MGSLLGYVLNFDISGCMVMGVGRSIFFWGAHIHIFIKQSISKEVNDAEHEYMNMSTSENQILFRWKTLYS